MFKHFLDYLHSKKDDTSLNVPLTIDIIAALLQTGISLPSALYLASPFIDSDSSHSLTSLAANIESGLSMDAAWIQSDADSVIRPIIRACIRASSTGASISGSLIFSAEQIRKNTFSIKMTQIQRASVLVVLPLGLCFLPAFIALGIVPLLIAVFNRM